MAISTAVEIYPTAVELNAVYLAFSFVVVFR